MAHLITALILIPFLGAIAVCVWPFPNARPIALTFNVISALVAGAIWR